MDRQLSVRDSGRNDGREEECEGEGPRIREELLKNLVTECRQKLRVLGKVAVEIA